jgi:hypothetical protein
VVQLKSLGQKARTDVLLMQRVIAVFVDSKLLSASNAWMLSWRSLVQPMRKCSWLPCVCFEEHVLVVPVLQLAHRASTKDVGVQVLQVLCIELCGDCKFGMLRMMHVLQHVLAACYGGGCTLTQCLADRLERISIGYISVWQRLNVLIDDVSLLMDAASSWPNAPRRGLYDVVQMAVRWLGSGLCSVWVSRCSLSLVILMTTTILSPALDIGCECQLYAG